MAIVNFNNISGINSITAQSNSLNFYTAAGNNLPITAATLNVGTGASVSSPSSNVLTLGTNNAERIRIGSTGSVGIGTNESYGDSNANFTSLSLGGNGTRYGLIELNKSDGIAGSWIDCYGTGGNGDLRITTAGTSGAITFWTGGEFTEKIRINSSGYVGIGSTTPGFQLTVDQATTDGNLVDIKNEEVRLLTGTWGTGSTYPREVTLNATRFDSGALPALRLAGQGGLKFAVDLNTVRMEVDTSGRVLKPYTPHIFGSVTNTTTVSNSFANSFAVVTSTELTFATDRITVPVGGLYLITFCTLSNQDSSRKDALIVINGTTRAQGLSEDTTTGYHYRGISMVMKLAANDYIQFYNQNWYSNTSTNFDAWRTASVTFLG